MVVPTCFLPLAELVAIRVPVNTPFDSVIFTVPFGLPSSYVCQVVLANGSAANAMLAIPIPATAKVVFVNNFID